MRYAIRIVLTVAAIALAASCSRPFKPFQDEDIVRLRSGGQTAHANKPVILLLVDSLMYQTIDRGIREGKLPAFRYLIEHGQYYRNLVSGFPTMSVSIDSTLLTGANPDRHRVPGLVWYSATERRLVNYGTDPLEVVKTGFPGTFRDALLHLNQSHLNPKISTLYEELERKGLSTGSVNGLVFRGTFAHRLTVPAWLRTVTGLPSGFDVKGPAYYSFGAFSNPLKTAVNLPEGATERFGFNNRYAIEMTAYLVKHHLLPDFLYVYLPDLDQKLHKSGPDEFDGVAETDRQLDSLLQSFGSREQALERAVFVISGDSGMTRIASSADQPTIDLPALLLPYKILLPSRRAAKETELALAVNETMAYVYKLNTKAALRDIASQLCGDARIDFAAWEEGGSIHVMQGGTRKTMRYRPGKETADSYGQAWMADGAVDVLDLRIDHANKTLNYGRYPDVLQRLSAALHSHDGEFLVVTAKEGYELATSGSPVHREGGGHGGLTATESLVPLIIAGTDAKPDKLRIVDLKDYLLKLLLDKSEFAKLGDK
ncbi:alkaline phosphatase family protein [Paenibacillus thailandensis]|uniref:Alkaline phosphatase family protein n=1 Tax=Paenibacillus thailandensis TaxID=393250 RepID=A0ABW5QV06_9BACL